MDAELSVDPCYEYNAPQFVDFDQLGATDDENVEDYFNFDHENGKPVVAETFEEEELFFTPDPQVKTGKSPYRRNTPRSCRTTPKRVPQEQGSPATAKENVLPPNQTANNAMAVLKKATEGGMPTIKPVLANICADVNAFRNRPTINATVSATAQSHAAATKPRRKSNRKSFGGLKVPKSLQHKRYSHEGPAFKKQKHSAAISLPKHQRSNSQAEPLPKKHQRSNSQAEPLPTKHQRSNSFQAEPLPKKLQRSNSSVAANVQPARNHSRKVSVEVKKVVTQQQQPARSSSSSRSNTTTRLRRRTASIDNGLPVKAHNSSSASRPAAALAACVKKNTSMDTASGGADSKTKGKLTMPATPSFMKRKPLAGAADKSSALSTEQLELEKIKEMRRELERKRRLAEESHKQAKVAHSYVPKHCILKPTRPHEFKFATDERVKDHGMETRQDAGGVVGAPPPTDVRDFAMQLRHNAQPAAEGQHKPLCPTKPQPFEFHERKRKRTSDAEGKSYQFVSMAESAIAFARKTPDRFRRKPKNTEMCHKEEKELTVPKTPQLISRKRSRPVGVKSHAELEEEAAEQIKKYKFHAQPVNLEMLKKQTGVKKVASKELTKPVDFDLETDRRGQYRHENSKSLEQEAEATQSRPLRAKAFTGIPFMPKCDHKVTEPKPFSFDEKDRDRFAKKEEKIRQVVDDEKRVASEFRAQPIPDSSPVLPERQRILATQPEPFKLMSDNRGAQKAEEWNQMIKEELKQQRAAATFHARPNNVVHQKPFVPAKSTKPLTDLGDVELYTERRAEKRAEFEAQKHEHELEAEESRRAQDRMRSEDERREYERQRANAVHRAGPVKKFRSVEVRPSDRPLTQPITPRFSTRTQRHRGSNNSSLEERN